MPKEIFHANIGTIKGQNSKDLTEAEEFKKRWQEYTEELYKKDTLMFSWAELHIPIFLTENYGHITKLQPTGCE